MLPDTLRDATNQTLELVPNVVSATLVSQHALLPGAKSFSAAAVGEGMKYRFAAGALQGLAWLSADFLLDGDELTVFQLRLQEGESGPRFDWSFGLLNGCAARLRLPLAAVDQNRWMYPREGALLKPLCSGQRVDLARVDRLELIVLRQGDAPSRWSQTPLVATVAEPSLLDEPLLTSGPLLDEFGQSTGRQWPGKTSGEDELLTRLQTQHAMTSAAAWPHGFSQWGGDRTRRFAASGWFATHHDGVRWWLLDPDGHPFWSSGLDCVTPVIDTPFAGLQNALTWLPPRQGAFAQAFGRGDSFNYLAANFIRAFGPAQWRAAWAECTFAHLREWGFNTVANWSQWQQAKAAQFPYVRPLEGHFPTTPLIYRDFPDVFDAKFAKDADAYALQLCETSDDPAMIGYFLMNEPTWGFAQETPAAGMLCNNYEGAARRALTEWLRQKYQHPAALHSAWGINNFETVATGPWKRALTAAARTDLADFSAVLVKRFFEVLTGACRTVDPHHLNLGARYYTTPPTWCLAGMRHFDVFSMNCYDEQIPADKVAQIAELLQMPVLIGEWHFGALDAGLPASGIGRVRSQAERGAAFRVYTETAAAHPACVGVHYFTLYDQSATGRFDGENYNIGFLDVCNHPYPELAAAARQSHQRLYEVANGEEQPFEAAPEYLPKLFV